MSRAWEVVVGQTMDHLAKSPHEFDLENLLLIDFIGRDCLMNLGFDLS